MENAEFEQNRMRHQKSPILVAIGGGKGGIGKSFLAANLGIALAQQSYRTILIDLDLGAANLHTCLGVSSPQKNLFDFFQNRVNSMSDIIVPTGVPLLGLIAGGLEFWQQIRPQTAQKVRVISSLHALYTDFVIIDLGAGSHVTTQDFFIFSNIGVVVVMPEPTSIENAYVFLKGMFVRRLETIVRALNQREPLLEKMLYEFQNDPKNQNVSPLGFIKDYAKKYPTTGQYVLNLIQKTKIGIIVNQVRTHADFEIGHSMKQIILRYFGFHAEFLGAVGYDDAVWKAIRARRPLLLAHANAPASLDVQKIATNLAQLFFSPSSEKVGTESFLSPNSSGGFYAG